MARRLADQLKPARAETAAITETADGGRGADLRHIHPDAVFQPEERPVEEMAHRPSAARMLPVEGADGVPPVPPGLDLPLRRAVLRGIPAEIAVDVDDVPLAGAPGPGQVGVAEVIAQRGVVELHEVAVQEVEIAVTARHDKRMPAGGDADGSLRQEESDGQIDGRGGQGLVRQAHFHYAAEAVEVPGDGTVGHLPEVSGVEDGGESEHVAGAVDGGAAHGDIVVCVLAALDVDAVVGVIARLDARHQEDKAQRVGQAHHRGDFFQYGQGHRRGNAWRRQDFHHGAARPEDSGIQPVIRFRNDQRISRLGLQEKHSGEKAQNQQKDISCRFCHCAAKIAKKTRISAMARRFSRECPGVWQGRCRNWSWGRRRGGLCGSGSAPARR